MAWSGENLFKKPAFGIAIAFILAYVIYVIIHFLIFSPSESSFFVEGRTEKIEFICYDENIGNYVFYDSKISLFDRTLNEKFNGIVRLRPGTKVSFERPSKLKLSIIFQNNEAFPPIKAYHDDMDGRRVFDFPDTLINYVEIEVPIANKLFSEVGNLYFPIDGQATIGNNIDRANWGEPVSLIIDGELSVIGRSMLVNKIIEYEKIQLHPGDLVSFHNDQIEASRDTGHTLTAQEKLTLKGQGFVIIDEGPGMKMNFRTIADKAVIYKTGLKNRESSYNFHTSILDKLLLDKVFHTISIFMAIITILAGGASLYFDYKGHLKRND